MLAVKCHLNCFPKISTLTFVFEEERVPPGRSSLLPTMSGNYATPPPQSATQETTLGQSNGFVDGSYPCGSLFGIPLRVHKLFVAYIVIVSVLGFIQGGLEGDSEYGFMLFLVNGPILFGTVLIHELGHCWATYRVGGTVEGILLWPLGGLAFIGHSGEAKEDLFVSVAGPLTHIPQMIVWVILLAASADGDATLTFSGAFFADLCRHAIVINLSLFLFNLFARLTRWMAGVSSSAACSSAACPSEPPRTSPSQCPPSLGSSSSASAPST